MRFYPVTIPRLVVIIITCSRDRWPRLSNFRAYTSFPSHGNTTTSMTPKSTCLPQTASWAVPLSRNRGHQQHVRETSLVPHRGTSYSVYDIGRIRKPRNDLQLDTIGAKASRPATQAERNVSGICRLSFHYCVRRVMCGE